MKSSETSPQTITHPQPEQTAEGLTLEAGLWLCLGLSAFLMRVFDIARWPLSESEAALALESWRFLSGHPYALAAESGTALSPLAFNLNALFFALFGASDVTARLAQALAGTGLVLVPWLLRPVLGRGYALAISALLLLSPSILFFSRHASGEIWGVLCALLLVAGVARWQQRGAYRDGLIVAVALGVGLASSPGFWTVLVAGVPFLLWEKRKASLRGETLSLRRPDRHLRWSLGIVALVLFVITSTALLTNPQGLGAALSLPVEWLRRLFGANAPPTQPFISLVVLYEILPLLAAIAGLSLLGAARFRWGIFGLLWLLVTLVPASLANSGWTAALIFVTVPLALLGGITVATILRVVMLEGKWSIDGFLFVLGLITFILFWILITAYLDKQSTQLMLALFLPPVLTLLGLLLSQQLYGGRSTRRVAGLTLLTWLTIVSLSNVWGLSLHRGADPREPLVTRPGSTDLRMTAVQLAEISVERYREASAIPVGVQRSLGVAPLWYLRRFDNLKIVEGSHPDLPEATLLDESEPAPPGRIGRKVWLGAEWQRESIQESPVEWLRWLIARSDSQGLAQKPAMLYLTLDE